MPAVTVEWLSVGEVAEIMNVSRSTVYQLMQKGAIPAKKFGHQWRMSRAVLDAMLTPTPLTREKETA